MRCNIIESTNSCVAQMIGPLAQTNITVNRYGGVGILKKNITVLVQYFNMPMSLHHLIYTYIKNLHASVRTAQNMD